MRLVGMVNAAAWFGAAAFYLFVAGPAMHSTALQSLVGSRNFPYFSEAFAQLLAARYFDLHIICGLIALGHLTAEWLYLAKHPRRFWLGLAIGLVAWGLLQDYAVQPHLRQLHQREYTVTARADLRDAARRSFIIVSTLAKIMDYMMVAGLAVWAWRQANPPDAARFVPTAKFRG
ncbi:MAG: DUF4149 domain-containing protein [Verrucomicrobia bacterium]|nr:DUF4149 domain-containing protein [Verrucomicrobiota bacterium]